MLALLPARRIRASPFLLSQHSYLEGGRGSSRCPPPAPLNSCLLQSILPSWEKGTAASPIPAALQQESLFRNVNGPTSASQVCPSANSRADSVQFLTPSPLVPSLPSSAGSWCTKAVRDFSAAEGFQHRNRALSLQDHCLSEISVTGGPTKRPVGWQGSVRPSRPHSSTAARTPLSLRLLATRQPGSAGSRARAPSVRMPASSRARAPPPQQEPVAGGKAAPGQLFYPHLPQLSTDMDAVSRDREEAGLSNHSFQEIRLPEAQQRGSNRCSRIFHKATWLTWFEQPDCTELKKANQSINYRSPIALQASSVFKSLTNWS